MFDKPKNLLTVDAKLREYFGDEFFGLSVNDEEVMVNIGTINNELEMCVPRELTTAEIAFIEQVIIDCNTDLSLERKAAKLKLTQVVAELPAKIFADGDRAKLESIYFVKQRLVHASVGDMMIPDDWFTINIPLMCQMEWENRKLSGRTTVGAIGMEFEITSALQLFQTWWLNTYMGDWLLAKADIVRQDYEAQIENATNESDIDSLVAQFTPTLLSYLAPTGEFYTDVAPTLLASTAF